MTIIKLDLSLPLPTRGYRWVRETEHPSDNEAANLRLVPVTAMSDSGLVVQQHEPFKEKAHPLFHTFARIEPNCDGVVKFANEYGGLHDGPARAESNDTAVAIDQNTLHEWQREIVAMRAAVNLWEKIQNKDMQGLTEHIRWHAGPDGRWEVRYDSDPPGKPGQQPSGPHSRVEEVIASPTVRSELLQQMRKNDPAFPAFIFVQWMVNLRLKEFVEPTFLWEKDGPPLQLRLVPKCLLGGIWLEFAEAVSTNKKYRTCKICGKWYQLTKAAKSNKLTCSTVCRSQAYRDRIKLAQQWAKEEVPLDEIARRLGTSIKQIRKWLALGEAENDGKKRARNANGSTRRGKDKGTRNGNAKEPRPERSKGRKR